MLKRFWEWLTERRVKIIIAGEALVRLNRIRQLGEHVSDEEALKLAIGLYDFILQEMAENDAVPSLSWKDGDEIRVMEIEWRKVE